MALHARTRRGKISRRKLEFAIIRDQMKRDSKRLYARLLRNIKQVGECFVYTSAINRDGYANVSFKYKGRHHSIHAHRIFLMFQLGTPIPLGIDAGHQFGCPHRNCVLHVFAQPFDDNALTDPKGRHFEQAEY